MAGHCEGGSSIQTSSIYGVIAPDQKIYEYSFYLGCTINTSEAYLAFKASANGLKNILSPIERTKESE